MSVAVTRAGCSPPMSSPWPPPLRFRMWCTSRRADRSLVRVLRSIAPARSRLPCSSSIISGPWRSHRLLQGAVGAQPQVQLAAREVAGARPARHRSGAGQAPARGVEDDVLDGAGPVDRLVAAEVRLEAVGGEDVAGLGDLDPPV